MKAKSIRMNKANITVMNMTNIIRNCMTNMPQARWSMV
jgi:hypothetical protein